MTLYQCAARIDERGRISGGKIGDQGGEVCVCAYSDFRLGWDGVLRWLGPKQSRVRNRLMCAAYRIAKYDAAGYDQSKRVTLYNQMRRLNWLLRDVKKLPKCSCDCSLLMGVCANIALLPLNLAEVECPDYVYTGNMKAIFRAMGFSWITEGVDFETGAGLMPGDVLLNEDHHTSMFFGSKKSGERYIL